MLADEFGLFSSQVSFLRGPCFPTRPASRGLDMQQGQGRGVSLETPGGVGEPVLGATSASANEEPGASLGAELFLVSLLSETKRQ